MQKQKRIVLGTYVFNSVSFNIVIYIIFICWFLMLGKIKEDNYRGKFRRGKVSPGKVFFPGKFSSLSQNFTTALEVRN